MSLWRFASASAIATLVTLAGVTADAQFGNILKKAKPPGVPGAPSPSPAKSSFTCAKITDELADTFLKDAEARQRARKQTYDQEMAKGQAKKAEADALAGKRAGGMVNTMMATEECKDAFKAKDDRSKEIARLENLVATADEKGDEAKSDELRKKLDPLNSALDIDADRACGGKGTSALVDCMARNKAELARKGATEPMLTIQAQGECMSDPSTSGFAGATAASAEEETLNSMAADAMAHANEKAEQAEKDASLLDQKERAMFFECCNGVLNQDAAILSVTPLEVRGIIRNRADELAKLCK